MSSTCYDLGPVREHLREAIQTLGHDAMVSEYHSFPVNPSLDAIANCKKNVRDHTDIFVLIIGGMRGSVEPQSGNSVTNLEFQTAVASGLPIYVFVKKSVRTLLWMWKKNPGADFSPQVDAPEVFEFVESILAKNLWVREFDRTEEIIEPLKTQLTYLFRDLLARDRAGKLDPLLNFAADSSEAERIAREKPPNWEFLLVSELMKVKLKPIRMRYDDYKNGFIFIAGERTSASEFMQMIEGFCDDLLKIGEALMKQVKIRLFESLGPPGQPGDIVAIKAAVEGVASLFADMADCEKRLCTARPPDFLHDLRDSLRGIADPQLEKIEAFADDLARPFANGAQPTGKVHFQLTMAEPDLDRFNVELEKVHRRRMLEPELFAS